RYAQGGIAAAVGTDDSAKIHSEDTLQAGAGLCDPKAVDILTSEASQRIYDLISYGVPFDTFQGEIALAREAAHSKARILHAGGDATGKHIELTLAELARISGITILEYSLATQILKKDGHAIGVEALDTQNGTFHRYSADTVILATGGAGCLFRYTTNPQVATGDGVALAFSAGAQVADMEFVQFHPTALRLSGAPPFLISEAVRGEGGLLRNSHWQRFMQNYDPSGELAARDIVSQSINVELQKTNSDYVVLDVTHLKPEQITTRFPTIDRFCLDHGLDITKSPIPVAPAAHYLMGGIYTNTWGQTSLPNLYACGEVASSGVHGANRLASNSLLETLVFGKRLVQQTLKNHPRWDGPTNNKRDIIAHIPKRKPRGETPIPSLTYLQKLMWEKAGIVRNNDDLEHAANLLSN
ncbi:MAG: L-aspartate oxidase, partial [Anaerolineales bacterium]|nr:L-aspartate oxidase [Anaerolineales bacterium]